jgi:dTDP-4-dehydrorhamnose reductase
MKVLITGASGQVGKALLRRAPPDADIRPCTREQLDIADGRAVRAALAAFEPALIINAAAYTAVDKAESEPDLCATVNALAPRLLAEAALAIPGCRLLHISTDYAFDGRSRDPYEPADPTNPLSVYGRTKRAGEQAVLEVLGDRAVVLRTAWVYSAEGRNFLLTMLRLMRERGAVRVVADQRGTPTSADSIAMALWRIAQRPEIGHILHWTDAGEATWYDFAVAIGVEGLAAGLLSKAPLVTPISTAEYPTAAPRPANSVLDLRDSIARLGIAPAHWLDNLRDTLARIAHPGAAGRPHIT